MTNAARLKLDLLCRGVRIDPSCDLVRDARGVRRTRAGLGSGLELCLPGRRKTYWVNAPVVEPFVERSPWLLERTSADGFTRYDLRDERTGAETPVRIPSEPSWYGRRTASGREMAEVGVLQGTYLGVYVGGVCGFWAGRGLQACGFCTTGKNVGGSDEAHEKSVEDVVETALAAKRESGVTFVHLNAGYAGERTLDVVEPYARALKERVGCLVGVQATPAADLSRYDRLRDLGVDHLSFCYEFHDPAVLAEWCPGKARALGQSAYFRAIEHTSRRYGRGTCSGEIIAGVEPVAVTLAAIDWIASVGAFPTVCVFRPTLGSRMQDLPPPDPAAMEPVFREVWDACRRHLVPVGIAPNVEVSIVMTPDDCAELVERPGPTDLAWRAALRALRAAAGPRFRRRMRAAPRTASPAPATSA